MAHAPSDEAPAVAVAPTVDNPAEQAIRGGAIRVAGYALGVLVSLGAATVLVRYLGIVSFGRYVTVVSLVGIVGGVTEAGIVVFGIREFSARPPAERQHLMSSLLTLRLVLTAVGVVIALCFGLIVGYRHVLLVGTLLVGAALLVQVTADVLSVPLQVNLQLGRLTLVDLLRRTAALVLIAVLALLDARLVAFFAVALVSGVIALALLAWFARSSLRIGLSMDFQRVRRVFADTAPYAIAVSVASAYFYVTVIVMSLIASDTQTGLFSTSFRVIQVLLGIPALLLTAIFPLLSRSVAADTAKQAIGKVFTAAAICGAWLSLAVALGASFIIHVIAAGKADGAIPVLRIQAIVLGLSFISTSSSLTLVALRRYRALVATSCCGLAVNIAFDLALIPSLHARGGAIADVISELLVACVTTFALTRVVRGQRPSLSSLLALVLALALATCAVFAPVGALVQVILASAIYFGVLSVLGAIPHEVIDAFRNQWVLRRPPAGHL